MNARLKLMVASSIILVLTLGVLTGLASLVDHETQRQSTLLTYATFGNEAQKKISRAVRYGKPLNAEFGFEALVSDLAHNPTVNNIIIFDAMGTVIYTARPSNAFSMGQALPEGLAHNFDSKQEEYKYIPFNGEDLMLLPITARQGKIAGGMVVSFSLQAQGITELASLQAFLWPFVYSVVVGLLLLAVACYRMEWVVGQPNKKQQLTIFLCVLASQLFLCTYLMTQLYIMGSSTMQNKVAACVRVQADSVSRLLTKGLPLEEYARSADFFRSELGMLKDIKEFRIVNHAKEVIVNVEMQPGNAPLSRIVVPSVPLYASSHTQEPVGFIEVVLGTSILQQQLLKALLDMATTLVVSLLLVTEAVLFVGLPSARLFSVRTKNILSTAFKWKHPLLPISYARTMVALFSFASALTISFMPLLMINLLDGATLWGFSPTVASSFPLSAETFACIVSLFFVGTLSDKFGWQWPYMSGVILYAVASFLSATVSSPEWLIGIRALAGLGYGLSWLSGQAYVFSVTPREKRASGFAIMVAGIYTGYIAGVAVGGLLVSHFGTTIVFVLAVFVCGLCAAYLLGFMWPFFAYPHANVEIAPPVLAGSEVSQAQPVEKAMFQLLLAYVSDRKILLASLAVLVPFSMVQMGLLSFGVPMAMTQFGFSQASIARCIMLYGLLQVYVAPGLTHWCERFTDKRSLITYGAFIGVLGLLGATLYQNAFSLVLAIFCLGLSGATLGPAQAAYAADQHVANQLGMGRAVSVQRFADKMGQALGPLVFGFLFSTQSVGASLGILGLAFLFCILCFMIGTREKSKGIAPKSNYSGE